MRKMSKRTNDCMYCTVRIYICIYSLCIQHRKMYYRHTERSIIKVKNVAQNAHVVYAQMHVLIDKLHKWNGI